MDEFSVLVINLLVNIDFTEYCTALSPIMLLGSYPVILLLKCLLPVHKRTTEADEANQHCHFICL